MGLRDGLTKLEYYYILLQQKSKKKLYEKQRNVVVGAQRSKLASHNG